MGPTPVRTVGAGTRTTAQAVLRTVLAPHRMADARSDFSMPEDSREGSSLKRRTISSACLPRPPQRGSAGCRPTTVGPHWTGCCNVWRTSPLRPEPRFVRFYRSSKSGEENTPRVWASRLAEAAGLDRPQFSTDVTRSAYSVSGTCHGCPGCTRSSHPLNRFRRTRLNNGSILSKSA